MSPGRAAVVRRGFHGREYERMRGDLRAYDDRFDDYWGFLEPRLDEAWRLLADDGTLYLHLDYREAHYAKVLLDAPRSGASHFLNELIWAYDYGAQDPRSAGRPSTTRSSCTSRTPAATGSTRTAVDREPYMAPGLVTPEKAERGKLPTDVWWHTIVPTTGPREDRLSDAEARGHPAADRPGLEPPGRPGARLLRGQRHDRRRSPRRSAADAVLVDRQPRGDRRDAGADAARPRGPAVILGGYRPP